MTKKESKIVVTPPEPEPEHFDLEEWFRGLAPAMAKIDIDGKRFILQARTPEYIQELTTGIEDEDEQLHATVVAHIVSPEGVTVKQIGKLREVRAPEFHEMVTLVTHLSTRPLSQLAPRFLLDASD